MLISTRAHSSTALALLGVLLASTIQAQDLATLARKEKERRAKVTKPVKVLTEDDGKDASAKGVGSVTSLEPQAGSSAPAAAGAAASTTDPDAQRSAWKARADRARNAVTTAEMTLAQMERDVAAFRSDMAPVSAAEAQDPMRLQKRDARVFEMNKQIEAQKIAVTEAKKALAAFEEEARRAGVPAGWLR